MQNLEPPLPNESHSAEPSHSTSASMITPSNAENLLPSGIRCALASAKLIGSAIPEQGSSKTFRTPFM